MSENGGLGCGSWVAIAVAGVVAFAIFATWRERDESLPSTKEAVICDQEWAQGYVLVAQAKSIVRDAAVDATDGLIVVVSPTRWSKLEVPEHQRLAAAYDCAIAGNDGHLKAVRFRARRNGADLWLLSAEDLYRLRETGLAMPSPRPSAN